MKIPYFYYEIDLNIYLSFESEFLLHILYIKIIN